GAELGHIASARILCLAALFASGERCVAGHVCARLSKHRECGWRLGADLWTLGISRRGHYRLRMVHMLCSYLHDARARDHPGLGRIETTAFAAPSAMPVEVGRR